ncbi:hypothetical protein B8W93_11120 [Lentilactobacillus kefiri]|nr:hypothetical protein B9K02_11140 [Lentilactobacillus kefiri]PAK80740.1 hypothetical protein B8W85_11300 [Lentilactobacillus kefiri]PAL05217.1 hypothetical protein B8W93_11120 [Lentilactobacillus kefiri]QGV24527.1 hypothetical protein DNL43_04295 [Lentilactobacillus kefiri]
MFGFHISKTQKHNPPNPGLCFSLRNSNNRMANNDLVKYLFVIYRPLKSSIMRFSTDPMLSR